MKPLIVLIAVFCLSLLTIKIIRGEYEFALSGRIALSAMLVFSAIGHFAFTKGMSLMIPEFIPFKTEIIYLTGVVEILFAIGLFFPNYRVLTAWLIIVFLILVLPTNIYASIKHLDIQKTTFDGNGLNYLWFRIPLQILFIVWTYLSSIKN
jgi:Predicted membrane protein